MPADLPLPIDPNGTGTFLPAFGGKNDIGDWDPWDAIQVQKNYDRSRPLSDVYDEPNRSQVATFIGEWGGMPYPVRDYQDTIYSVLYSPRQTSYHESRGPAGQYMGPANTAWEFGAGQPQTDYWSTIILGAG